MRRKWCPAPGATRLAGVAVALGLAACRTAPPARTEWPPADFFLEVRARIQTAAGQRELQSLHVFADGFVVYREVDPETSFPGGWPPLFTRASAYRMLPQSTRSLARALQQAGLFALETLVGADPDADDVVSVRWHAFGRERWVVARGRVYGAFVEALHVVNSFLPADCLFELPDMTGEPHPPRLSRVPAPTRDLAGAYELHRRWQQRWPGDVQWRTEVFALALRAGDHAGARTILEGLERDFAAQSPLSDRAAGDALADLRTLLAEFSR